MHRRVIGLLAGRLARASVLMLAGTVAGGILGYVFQILMGRMLSITDYGLFSALMALFAVVSAPLSTLMLVVSRKVSEYKARRDFGSIAHFYRSVSWRTTVAAASVTAASALIAPYLQVYLKAPNLFPIYLLGLLFLLTVPPLINDGFLQGLQSFSWLSGSGALRVLLKIAFSGSLVWAGFRVEGAMLGAIAASVAAWFITFGPLRPMLGRGRARPYQNEHLRIRSSLPVLAANVAFASMTQLDMVLVNHYFAAREASIYAAASVLGKAVMYLPGGVAMALFPMVADNHARDKSSAHLLLQAVGLTAILCCAGAIFYLFFGEVIVRALYGESYREAGEVLRYFGFAILPMALVMVAEYFLIAKGGLLFAYLFLAIAPVQVLGIHFFHGSLQAVVMIVAATGTAVALIGYGMLWRMYRAA